MVYSVDDNVCFLCYCGGNPEKYVDDEEAPEELDCEHGEACHCYENDEKNDNDPRKRVICIDCLDTHISPSEYVNCYLISPLMREYAVISPNPCSICNLVKAVMYTMPICDECAGYREDVEATFGYPEQIGTPPNCANDLCVNCFLRDGREVEVELDADEDEDEIPHLVCIGCIALLTQNPVTKEFVELNIHHRRVEWHFNENCDLCGENSNFLYELAVCPKCKFSEPVHVNGALTKSAAKK